MSLRKRSLILCITLSVLCLVGGYGMVRQWIGAAIAILIGPAWLLARKYPASLLPLICLLMSIAMAVAGMLMGSPPVLMIFGATLALAAWDLVLLSSVLGEHSLTEQTQLFESQHLRSLLLALGSGLLVVFLGRFLTIQVPFLVLVLLVAFLLFALDRVMGSIKKTGT